MKQAMQHNDVIQALADQADYLAGSIGRDGQQNGWAAGGDSELIALFALAEQVRRALQSVAPSSVFVARLEAELGDYARRRASRELRIETSAGKSLMIGAAIGSAMALVGGIAYWMRNRGAPAGHVPAGPTG